MNYEDHLSLKEKWKEELGNMRSSNLCIEFLFNNFLRNDQAMRRG